jgi:hypothetical protein
MSVQGMASTTLWTQLLTALRKDCPDIQLSDNAGPETAKVIREVVSVAFPVKEGGSDAASETKAAIIAASMQPSYTLGTWQRREWNGDILITDPSGNFDIASITPRFAPSLEEAEANAKLLHQANAMAELLMQAVARVTLANQEGDPILSAWLPDAIKTLRVAGISLPDIKINDIEFDPADYGFKEVTEEQELPRRSFEQEDGSYRLRVGLEGDRMHRFRLFKLDENGKAIDEVLCAREAEYAELRLGDLFGKRPQAKARSGGPGL